MPRLLQELDAGHLVHPHVGDDQGDLAAPGERLAKRRDRRASAAPGDDFVVGAEAPLELVAKRAQVFAAVVDHDKQRRLG